MKMPVFYKRVDFWFLMYMLFLSMCVIHSCGEETDWPCHREKNTDWNFTDLTFTVKHYEDNWDGSKVYTFRSNVIYEGDKLILSLGETMSFGAHVARVQNDSTFEKGLRRDVENMVKFMCSKRKIDGTKLFKVQEVSTITFIFGQAQYNCTDCEHDLMVYANLIEMR